MEEDVTCARLLLDDRRVVYVRVAWLPRSFTLDVSDGFQAWMISPASEMIEDRASQWDQSVGEYLKDVRAYLSEQQPQSVYKLVFTEDNGARFSWTLERAGTKLESRWRLKEAPDSKQVNCQILDFALGSYASIKEELKQKTKTFNSMKTEVDRCLEQNKRLVEEKNRCEEELFTKFVALLNSKKAKLRELESSAPARITYGSKSSDRAGEDEDLGEDTDKEDAASDDQAEQSSGSDSARNVSESMNTNNNNNSSSSPDTVDLKGKQQIVADSPPSSINNRISKNNSRISAPEASSTQKNPEAEDHMASLLLNSSNYTSVPRKRRLL